MKFVFSLRLWEVGYLDFCKFVFLVIMMLLFWGRVLNIFVFFLYFFLFVVEFFISWVINILNFGMVIVDVVWFYYFFGVNEELFLYVVVCILIFGEVGLIILIVEFGVNSLNVEWLCFYIKYIV